MMIWKYTLDMTAQQFITMPLGAKILSVQVQVTYPCLWALVDPKAERTEERQILTIGTGNPTPEVIKKATFIGTYQLSGGALVFHVFEA